MAKYDQGSGCPCGLQKECDPGCTNYIPPPRKIFVGIGSRETPKELLSEITKFAAIMASKGWILRSGGAQGADTAFEPAI